MNLIKPIILIALLLLTGCNEIKLPESNYCDEISVYPSFTLIINNNHIKFNDSLLIDKSELRNLIIKERESQVESNRNILVAKLIVGKECLFSGVDSVLLELRKAFLLWTYIKTNSLSDSCWIRLNLPPFTPDFFPPDSIRSEVFSKSPEQKDSLNILLVKYYSPDSLIVNKKLISQNDFNCRLKFIIQSADDYTFGIMPEKENTIADIIQLMDLYLSTLEDVRAQYSLKKFNKTPDELNEYQIAELNYIFSRNLWIKLIN